MKHLLRIDASSIKYYAEESFDIEENSSNKEKLRHSFFFGIVRKDYREKPVKGRIAISCQAYDMFARIDISDTGPGISEEEVPKIFERFYRSPKASQKDGVGLGLFLAREIIAAEGGYIKVSSAPGRGSVFSVFLPRS